MKRRQFVFGSLKAMALLQPVLSLRPAFAQSVGVKRGVFVMHSNGYPRASDIFPSKVGDMTGSNFSMPNILQPVADLRSDMVIIQGINLGDGPFKPKSNNHVDSPAKIFTGSDEVINGGSNEAGFHAHASLDHIIATQRGYRSIELSVDTGNPKNNLRERPFASGPRAHKTAIRNPADAWDRLFKGATPPDQESGAEKERRLGYLRAKKSILDDLTEELVRFRREMASDTERLKLDIHEDAIRTAELSIAEDLRTTEEEELPPSACEFPDRGSSSRVPDRARAQLDLLFAALVCGRIQIGGLVWGWSGYRWRYEWVPGTKIENYHEGIAHGGEKSATVNTREEWIKGYRWDWEQMGAFARKLKATPDGEGNMLDSTLILTMNHFGNHHKITNIPVITLGGKNGGLQTGRHLKYSGESNNKVLTSVAHYMGVNLKGVGSHPNSGRLSGF